MGIGRDILNVDAPAMVVDGNRTSTYYEPPTVKSAIGYGIGLLRNPSKGNLKGAEANVIEHVRDILSDYSIGIADLACSKMLIKIFRQTLGYAELVELEFLKKTEMPYIRKFEGLFKKSGNGNKKVIGVTRHVLTNPFVKHFGLDDCVGNGTEVDKNDRIVGFYTPIRTAEDKRDAVKKKLMGYGISLGDCIAIGNGPSDRCIMEEAALSIASPLAIQEIRDIADYVVKGKYGFGLVAKDLEEELGKRFYQEIPMIQPLQI